MNCWNIHNYEKEVYQLFAVGFIDAFWSHHVFNYILCKVREQYYLNLQYLDYPWPAAHFLKITASEHFNGNRECIHWKSLESLWIWRKYKYADRRYPGLVWVLRSSVCNAIQIGWNWLHLKFLPYCFLWNLMTFFKKNKANVFSIGT